MECSSFRRAAGKTWAEKAKNACMSCIDCNGNFPLDPNESAADETGGNHGQVDRIEQLISRAEYFRAAARSGFEIAESRITPLEFKTMVLLERMEKSAADFERRQMMETLQALSMAMTMRR